MKQNLIYNSDTESCTSTHFDAIVERFHKEKREAGEKYINKILSAINEFGLSEKKLDYKLVPDNRTNGPQLYMVTMPMPVDCDISDEIRNDVNEYFHHHFNDTNGKYKVKVELSYTGYTISLVFEKLPT